MDIKDLDSLKGKVETAEKETVVKKTPKHSDNQPMNWKWIKEIFKTDNDLHNQFMENFLFNFAKKLCSNYTGGQWFVGKVGSLFYVYPNYPEKLNVTVDSNFFSDEMDAKSFGCALTMFVINIMCWRAYEDGDSEKSECLGELFHAYRDTVFSDDQKELDVAKIIRFLD